MRYLRWFAAMPVALLTVVAEGQSVIDFDHAAGQSASRVAHVSDGETIVINVTETCPSEFVYEYVGYELPRQPAPSGQQAAPDLTECKSVPGDQELQTFFEQNAPLKGLCSASRETIRIPHQAKFGSYLVEVRRKERKDGVQVPVRIFAAEKKQQLIAAFIARAKSDIQAAIEANTKEPCDKLSSVSLDAIAAALKELKQTSLIVTVENVGWTYGLAGAFTGSTVTDPVFALVDDGASGQVVIRDKGGEDDAALGVAAMIHLYNADLDGWRSRVAVTFGLGVGESNDVSYFVGPSWRFGKQAFATIGANLASVNRLPAGQRTNQPPQSENVLNNLGSKTEVGVFLSLSYSFLSPGESAFKSMMATKDSSPSTE